MKKDTNKKICDLPKRRLWFSYCSQWPWLVPQVISLEDGVSNKATVIWRNAIFLQIQGFHWWGKGAIFCWYEGMFFYNYVIEIIVL